MATTGRSYASAPDECAETLASARFVRVLARATGDSVAAAGLLTRTLAARGVPFQASVARTDPDVRTRLAVDDGVAVLIGPAPAAGVAGKTTDDEPGTAVSDPDEVASNGLAEAASNESLEAVSNEDSVAATRGNAPERNEPDVLFADEPASVAAFRTAEALEADPDPVLALAGAVAAEEPASEHPELVEAAELERRPGVGVPVADVVDGLAHTTLAHADFSGDEDAVKGQLATITAPDPRTVASLLALATVGNDGATPRAGVAVERALRPHETDGPFATLEGYADVLEVLARTDFGIAMSLAIGRDVREEALARWRERSRSAHAALRAATTGRYDGLFVARVESAPVETAARLCRDFRSPEPAVLVLSDEEAGAASIDPAEIGPVMARAADAVGGDGGGTERTGYARFDGEAGEFLTAFREGL